MGMAPSTPLTQDSATQAARRAAIVSAGKKIFFQCGFGGASMNAIASELGGSKTTLWSYFPSKESLFEAVVDDLVAQYGSAIEAIHLDLSDAVAALERFGYAVLSTVTSPEVMSLHRLIISEATRFPKLGRLYESKGRGRALERLASFFVEASKKDLLKVDEHDQAARYFLALCEAGSAQALMLGLIADVTPGALQREARDAVKAFYYGFALKD